MVAPWLPTPRLHPPRLFSFKGVGYAPCMLMLVRQLRYTFSKVAFFAGLQLHPFHNDALMVALFQKTTMSVTFIDPKNEKEKKVYKYVNIYVYI